MGKFKFFSTIAKKQKQNKHKKWHYKLPIFYSKDVLCMMWPCYNVYYIFRILFNSFQKKKKIYIQYIYFFSIMVSWCVVLFLLHVVSVLWIHCCVDIICRIFIITLQAGLIEEMISLDSRAHVLICILMRNKQFFFLHFCWNCKNSIMLLEA